MVFGAPTQAPTPLWVAITWVEDFGFQSCIRGDPGGLAVRLGMQGSHSLHEASSDDVDLRVSGMQGKMQLLYCRTLLVPYFYSRRLNLVFSCGIKAWAFSVSPFVLFLLSISRVLPPFPPSRSASFIVVRRPS